jgi:hypothetical protein
VKSLFSMSLMLWRNKLVASVFTTFLMLNAWGGGGSTVVKLLSHHMKVQGSSPAAVTGYRRKKMVIKIESLPTMCSSLIDSWFT